MFRRRGDLRIGLLPDVRVRLLPTVGRYCLALRRRSRWWLFPVGRGCCVRWGGLHLGLWCGLAFWMRSVLLGRVRLRLVGAFLSGRWLVAGNVLIQLVRHDISARVCIHRVTIPV